MPGNSPSDDRINFRLRSEDHPQLAQALAAAAATGRRGALTRRVIELLEKGLLYESMVLHGRHQIAPPLLSTASPQQPQGALTGPSDTGEIDQKLRAIAEEFD